MSKWRIQSIDFDANKLFRIIPAIDVYLRKCENVAFTHCDTIEYFEENFKRWLSISFQIH